MPHCTYISSIPLCLLHKTSLVHLDRNSGSPFSTSSSRNEIRPLIANNDISKMSSSYAILGATGNCGSALIQVLLKSPNNKINAYCRNKGKLTRLLPEVVENKRVEVFEGSIQDVDLMARCVRGCRAVFLAVSSNDNIPGCDMAQNLTKTVIHALEKLKTELGPSLQTPKLVLLSSATIDDHLARDMPKWFRPIMLLAGSYVYDDLKVAESLMRAESSWISSIFMKPAGLSVDVGKGHRLTLDEEESFIAYPDLAAGMIEAANEEDGRYDMKNVGVVNTNGSAKFPRGTPLCILYGLLRHYFPFLHPYLPSAGPS